MTVGESPVAVPAIPPNAGVESPVTSAAAGRVRDTLGARVSTVIERLAGVASALPATSVARASKLCAPSASAAVVCGEVQAAKAAASTRHSNDDPASEANENVGVLSLVVPLGPAVIVVSGGVVSTVNERVAGEASTLPEASFARTANVCAPSGNYVVVSGDVQAAKAAVSMRHSNIAPAS